MTPAEKQALRARAHLRVAVERELRDLGAAPLKQYASADAAIDAARECLAARATPAAVRAVEMEEGG